MIYAICYKDSEDYHLMVGNEKIEDNSKLAKEVFQFCINNMCQRPPLANAKVEACGNEKFPKKPVATTTLDRLNLRNRVFTPISYWFGKLANAINPCVANGCLCFQDR